MLHRLAFAFATLTSLASGSAQWAPRSFIVHEGEANACDRAVPPAPATFRSRSGGVVCGTVVTVDGTPIPGADVAVYDTRLVAGTPMPSDVTTLVTEADVRGRFAIFLPKEKLVSLTVTGAGYLHASALFKGGDHRVRIFMAPSAVDSKK